MLPFSTLQECLFSEGVHPERSLPLNNWYQPEASGPLEGSDFLLGTAWTRFVDANKDRMNGAFRETGDFMFFPGLDENRPQWVAVSG